VTALELVDDAPLGSTMSLTGLRSFLILLVLAVPADDIVAADTPDPDDDIFATQNNNFLVAVRAHRGRPAEGEAPPLLCGLDAQTSGCSAITPAIVRLLYPNRFPWLLADPLYYFMSLQC
jgi:hypothetical protein